MNKINHWGLRATIALLICGSSASIVRADTNGPVKVFILAGDENVLEQGIVGGPADGGELVFHPGATSAKNEPSGRVNYAIYKGAYAAGTDYDALTPETSGVVDIGEKRTQRRSDNTRGKVETPVPPFPELAEQKGYTTVLRGYISVPRSGQYMLLPGEGDSAFNVTSLEGREVYRKDVGQVSPVTTSVQLESRKRYPFRTIYFEKPGHEFRARLSKRPGSLETAIAENPGRWGFLKDADGGWGKRADVVVYDGQPIYNETKAPGRLLQVPADPKDIHHGVGPDLMLGHILGERFDALVLIHRFGTRHPVWFLRGSRSLGQDYLSPSAGGNPELKGGWDVIHFNFGVHDSAHRNPNHYTDRDKNKWPITVSIEQYEANLRKLVARLKSTGATLIWATTTPIADGTDGWFKGAEGPYNEVATRIMNENGVLIDDLHAEAIRQGYPKAPNVHSVGHLAPKVTEAIRSALASRKQSTKPLPRVLLIGDSITGTYQQEVMKNLDGIAAVYKNPTNAGHSGNGVAHIEEWLDIKRYLQNGQEYLELLDSVQDLLAHPDRFIPAYKNQGCELAGMVWFQGIADSQSDAYSAAYEKNLASLVRDLRRDFKAPALPVVVAAVAFGGTNMNANTRKIFEAQMAVGDPARYPEFSGNVKSIDTHRFCRSGSQSACYNENAETFLEIGEAMGRSMLEMLGTNPPKQGP